MKLYFAYGANLHLDNMARRCPKAWPRRSFNLRDWQLVFQTHAQIEPCAGAVVPGALWEITPECEESLDRFEGYPVYYQKRVICTDLGEVMFYHMWHDHAEMPGQGYLDIIRRGYHDWGLDLDQLHQALQITRERVQLDHWWDPDPGYWHASQWAEPEISYPKCAQRWWLDAQPAPGSR